MASIVRYDAQRAPNPQHWLAMDEAERAFQVQAYHRRTQSRLPNATLHTLIHVIVENQIAMGDDLPVAGILNRLLAEGLDRHDALHAIGSVLVQHMHGILSGSASAEDVNPQYFDDLSKLTAEGWKVSG